MLQPLHPLRGGKGEGLYGPGKERLPRCLSHFTLFLSTLHRHADADHRRCCLLGLRRHLWTCAQFFRII